MNIKIDATYFSLKCKPTLLRPLSLIKLKNKLTSEDN